MWVYTSQVTAALRGPAFHRVRKIWIQLRKIWKWLKNLVLQHWNQLPYPGARIRLYYSWYLEMIKPVNPKGNQSWIFIGRTDAEAETPILWPPDARTNSLEKTLMLGKIEGGRRGRQRRDGWMTSPTQWTWVWASSGVGDGQGSLACCSPWGHKESDTTEQLN